MDLVRLHPQASCDIVAGIEFPWPVPEMLLQHHERLDGSGYPRGLSGDEIVIDARIIAVADTLDAMTTDRPYQSAMELEYALEQIKRLAGTKFDPAITDALDAAVQAGALRITAVEVPV